MYISTGSYLNSMWAMEDRCIDDVIMNSLVLLYFIKNRFHVANWVCALVDHKRSQNMVQTSVTYLAAPLLDIICNLSLKRCTVTWNIASLPSNLHQAILFLQTLYTLTLLLFIFSLLFSVHFLDSNEEDL